MRQDMQAVVFHEPWKASIEERETPTPKAGEALVRTAYASVCGSDLAMFKGTWHGYTYPVVPGHEWAGEVVAVGSGVDGGLVGRSVVGDPVCPCLTCPACVQQQTVLCTDLVEVGFSRPGAFAEYFTIPAGNLFTLPAGVALRDACQIEPLAVALHAIDLIGLRPGEKVAVLGAGGVGQLLLRASALVGAEVTVVSEPRPGRREAAARAGAQVVGGAATGELASLVEQAGELRPDVVFDASGSPEAVQDALEVVRPGGRVCLVGYRVDGSGPMTPYLIPVKALTVRGVLGPGSHFEAAVRAVVDGRIEVSSLLTDEFALGAHRDAIDAAANGAGGHIRSVFRVR
jgi:2-desacetyl-2-hydroxyethyl bacteriochlorophyllide A dehydrogenase